MDRILGQGKFARLVDRDGWEFIEQLGMRGIVVILAEADGRLLLVEQFRKPLNAHVIELPAGVAGDLPGAENEKFEQAAARELLEETGYAAAHFKHLLTGPASPGRSNFLYTFFHATGLEKRHAGGGDAHEAIRVHEVPVSEVHDWLARKSTEGLLIDPKIYAGLYFLGRNKK
jgi:ADP-ribose pyrophosphatase